jgi:hypothetical protein
VPLIILGGLWLVHVAILMLALSLDPQQHIKGYHEPLMIFSAAILMMLGVGWLLSVAIGATMVSFLLIAHVGERADLPNPTIVLLMGTIPAAAGLCALVAGSVHYLWRVAP